MKFVLAAHGTRGDVEPCAAVGVELRRRGHEVRMAVPPNLVDFVELAGLSATSYGPDSREQIVAVADFTHNAFKIQNPVIFLRAGKELFVKGWAEMSRTLTSLADGADLLLTGQTYHGLVANVAEYYDIPVAALHHFPVRVNGQVGLPFLPSPGPLVRTTMKAGWWLYSHIITKADEEAQRRELSLPPALFPASQRMAEGETLEIQAYDQAVFPGLAAEWNGRRPFVGALTLDLTADTDDEVASWIAAGKTPIYFGFGSTPVQSPAETVAVIAGACAELGERALIYSGTGGSEHPSHPDHVKLVGQVNYTKILPMCRAAVHHGGAGTTAAGLRAGLPTLILWDVADQFIWATQVKRLKVGSAKRLWNVSRKSLVKQLRKILAPDCKARAREIAPRMTKPTVGVATAADLLEQTVHARSILDETIDPVRKPSGAAQIPVQNTHAITD
ncbi:glycosyltransferase [Bradyrhizobium erythrophlei]|uniref:UDP:flavonoid glycosyltransferase YjiC, YdhE family n=1 Tax=Bradyrhizobium erythrophlei TaxID=1437360 RepID=A0A1M5U8U2_9BRAD|nr:glycosyltransferase [Bradyrhizobium erythrophlei]SHH59276.1 UDP:flavonoid glycosyltransferase YjiC, YdhE family [Bradyrhizobium erythrophlei]